MSIDRGILTFDIVRDAALFTAITNALNFAVGGCFGVVLWGGGPRIVVG